MTNKYDIYIKDLIKKESSYGKCEKWSEEMNKTFPELVRVKGFYHCPIWGRRTHWWLKTKDDIIVDPSKDQFPSKGYGKYEELQDFELEERVPTGVCLYCGEEVYKENIFCSDKCGNLMANCIYADMNFNNRVY